MPMGIVSDEEFEQEIINSEKKPAQVILPIEKPGRKEGDVNVPDSLRKIIGEESVINGRSDALALARMFGVSDSSVSAYSHGATSTDSYNKPDSKLQNYLNNRKNRVSKRALGILTKALSEITPEKLSGLKVKDCAAVAKDMSAIVRNMEDKVNPVLGDQQNNQFIFYAPKFRNEEQYQTIEARE